MLTGQQQIVRPLATRDIPQLVRIEEQATMPTWKRADFVRSVKGPPHCYVLEKVYPPLSDHPNQSEIVGFILYDVDKSQVNILRIGVSLLSRRQGVASELIRTVIEEFRTSKLEQIEWVIDDDNFELLRLLTKLGFRLESNSNRRHQVRNQTRYYTYYRERLIPHNRIAQFGYGKIRD